MVCKHCKGQGLYEVVPDIPAELRQIIDGKFIQGKELGEYVRGNMPNNLHNYASEDSHYGGVVGGYPCPYCGGK